MPLSEILRRARIVARALPTRAAAATAVLVAIATHVVPVLPAPMGAKVAAVVASLIGGIAAVVKVVARLAEVPEDAIGLVLPEGVELRQELVGKPWPAGHVHPD